MKIRITSLLLFIALLQYLPSHADDGMLINDGHHFMSAHTHGLAALNLVSDNKELEILLISPSVNLVGFENKAVSKTQRNTLQKTEQVLRNTEALFIFNGTNCSLQHVEIDLSSIAPDQSEHNHNNAEHHHAHEKDTSHHSDIIAKYSFSCDEISSLKEIDLGLLDLFKGIEELKTTWLIGNTQGVNSFSSQQTLLVIE